MNRDIPVEVCRNTAAHQHDHHWEFRNGWHYCLICGEPEAGMPTNYRAHQCASSPCACDLSLTLPARGEAS